MADYIRCPSCSTVLEKTPDDVYTCVYGCGKKWIVIITAVDNENLLDKKNISRPKEIFKSIENIYQKENRKYQDNYQREKRMYQDGVFPHECEEEGCHLVVPFDDEPKCFKHSPDSGSSVKGYSARERARIKAMQNVKEE